MAASASAGSVGNFFSMSRRSGRYWWWKRGASAACWTLRLLSTMEMMSLATVVMMVEPPGEPRTRARLGLPGLYQWVLVTSMVGVMAESGRLPGSMALAELWMRPNMFGTPTLE